MAKVKKKDHENLTDANIEKVISLLENDKPITKKAACEILNISYNTTRLTKIIEEFKENKVREEKLRAANRGKPAQPYEIQEAIQGYLDGEAVGKIADRLYRPSSFIKNIIDTVGVPTRSGGDYFHPELLPEQCIRDTFEVGQVVWSSRYQKLAIILKESNPTSEYKVYEVYVVEPIEEVSPYFPHITGYGGRYAAQAAFDLGSLEHLKQHGVDVYKPLRAYFPKMLAGR